MKKRIAFIVDNFPVLSQTFILNQITGLIAYGYDVDIYANPSQEMTIHDDVNKYNLLSRTSYFPQPSQHHPVTLCKSLHLLLQGICKSPHVLNQLYRNISALKTNGLPIWFLPYLASPFFHAFPQNYDIIHCHFGPNGIKGLALKRMGLITGKLITSFHGYDITKYISKYGATVYHQLFAQGDLFLPISKHWQNQLIELGCKQDKIRVHRMGVNCEKFTFTPRQYHHSQPIQILTIARLVEKKGVEYGIRAVAQLASTHPNICYKIIGDGCLNESLQVLIQRLNIVDKIELLGWKEQSEIREILNQSQILIAPSITSRDGDQEGIPVVLMEAMAMGIPVISTLHSGIPELVKDGVTGFLVPEKDVEALSQKIKYLIENPQVWEKIGHAGRKFIEENHNQILLNRELVDIYEKL